MIEPILLVDDDENDVFFMMEAFRKAGIQESIRIARDGREAIEWLRACKRLYQGGPQLVILDLKLPFVMGLDVLRCLRGELGLLTVVIVMSASAERSDIANAYTAGANAYLVKPTDTSRLQEIVKSIQAFWLKENTFAQLPARTD
jgi:DNA-binding response OmpR family regulator